MKYEAVIGLEVHAELSTKAKLFCGCSTRFGAPENTQCCPVCTGMPGALPVLNQEAINKCVKAGLALGSSVSSNSRYARKHYFYPDLPKAYQISQYDRPLCIGGELFLPTMGAPRRVRIERIHLEEDAGKLTHSPAGTRIDYNRSGIPLIEIVTEPDLRSPEEVKLFLKTLRNILLYAGVSDCKMEEGSLRCDVNVSLRVPGEANYGTRTEMKNIHSFRAVCRAAKYEIDRQAAILDRGGTVSQETLKWDDEKGRSYLLRTKEDAEDYRFFSDPDLVPVCLPEARVNALRDSLPELPLARKERYMRDYAFSDYDAAFLSNEKYLSDYFEACIHKGGDPKSICNALMGDISKLRNASEQEAIPFSPKQLVRLLSLIQDSVISGPAAKRVLSLMFRHPEDPEAIVHREGLAQITDDAALLSLINTVIAENAPSVAAYQNGKSAAMGYLVGQVMRASANKADPKRAQALIKDRLDRPHAFFKEE